MARVRLWLAVAVAIIAALPPPSLASGRHNVGRGDRMATGCHYQGQSYPEGQRSEGSSADHLCLPAGICLTASVVLAIYQCSGGQWRCVRNCPR